jgi:hypothetical protein
MPQVKVPVNVAPTWLQLLTPVYTGGRSPGKASLFIVTASMFPPICEAKFRRSAKAVKEASYRQELAK